MRREFLVLKDAIYFASRILDKVEGVDPEVLNSDRDLQDIIVHNLQHLTQNVKEIPDEWRQTQPHIPWTLVAGFRNLAVHNYHELDMPTVIEICLNDVAPLQQALKEIAREVSGPLLAQDDLP